MARKRTYITKEIFDKIHTLRDSGLTFKEIGKVLNMNHQTVFKVYHRTTYIPARSSQQNNAKVVKAPVESKPATPKKTYEPKPFVVTLDPDTKALLLDLSERVEHIEHLMTQKKGFFKR